MSRRERVLGPVDASPHIAVGVVRSVFFTFAIAVAFLGPLTPSVQADFPCFAPVSRYAVDSWPTSVIAANLDGDEDQDLAGTSEGGVFILKNNGDGTYAAAIIYAAGPDPNSVFAADLDGDADQDLAVTDRGYPYSVSILKNNGDGTFIKTATYAAGGYYASVVAADLDGDGDKDLAVAGGSGVSVLKNNGDGTFAAPVTYAPGTVPQSVFAADLDGDGDQDLVGASGSASIWVLRNNGDGAFAAPVSYAVGSYPRSVSAADLDGDGDHDLVMVHLVVVDGSHENGSVSVLKNNGDGTYAAPVSYAVGRYPRSLSVADLDGDGDRDLVTINLRSNNVSVLRNNGDGTYATAVNFEVCDEPWTGHVADLDGDVSQDLIIVNHYGREVSILWNEGNGDFAGTGVNYAAGVGPKSVAAADLDGDGTNDLAVANNTSNDISVLLNNGNGIFLPAVNYAVGSRPGSIVAADLDGNGTNDLAVANTGSDNVSILRNDGNGTLGPPANYGAGTGPSSVFAADLDADGYFDLAVANFGSNDVSVLRNNRDGTFSAPVNYTTGTNPSCVVAADLDGDGYLDLAVANSGGGDASVLKNNRDGTFGAAVNYAVGSNPSSLFAADLSEGIDVDLAVANQGSDRVSILENNGDGIFSVTMNYAAGSGPTSVSAADLNGDGHLDLAIGNGGSGSVSTLESISGFDFWGRSANYTAGSDPRSVFAADLDGNGNLDLVVANFGSNNISIRENFCVCSLNVVSRTSEQWGEAGTLFSAITFANSNPGPDTITFSAYEYQTGSSYALPPLSDPSGGTAILGFTASGAVYPSAPTVWIGRWSQHLPSGAGLRVQSSHNQIEGLKILLFEGAGIAVTGPHSVSNTIMGCQFQGNTGPGIDLGNDGVTPNDPGDADSGPNTLLDYPVFDSVFQIAGDTFTVFGTSAPLSRVDLFLAAESGNPELQPEGTDHGPAYRLLSWTVADIGGKFKLDSIAEPEWSQVTATATDMLGNTSEFAQNKFLTPDPMWITAYSEPLPPSGELKSWSGQSPSMQITVFNPPDSAGKIDSIGPTFNTFGSRARYDSLTDWDGGGKPDARVWISSPDTGTYRYVFVLIGDPGSYLTGIGIDAHAEVRKKVVFTSTGLMSVGQAVSATYRLAPPTRGELNDDWVPDVFDVIKLIDIVYAGEPMPDPPELGDVNCDNFTDLLDIVYLITYTFNGGDAPCQ